MKENNFQFSHLIPDFSVLLNGEYGSPQAISSIIVLILLLSVVTFFDGFLVKLFDGCDLANYTLPLFPSE